MASKAARTVGVRAVTRVLTGWRCPVSSDARGVCAGRAPGGREAAGAPPRAGAVPAADHHGARVVPGGLAPRQAAEGGGAPPAAAGRQGDARQQQPPRPDPQPRLYRQRQGRYDTPEKGARIGNVLSPSF